MINYILILGAVQGLFLAVFLFTKNENKIANRLLGFALFGYSIDILNTLYVYSKVYIEYPFFIGMFALMPFLYAPSIYLYAKVLGKKEGVLFPKKYLIHFIPFIFFQIIGPLYLGFQDESFKMSLMTSDVDKPMVSLIVGSLIPFYGLTYVILAIIEARKFNREIRNSYSNIEKVKVDWLLYLLIGIVIIWLLELVQFIITEGLTISNLPMYLLIYIAISILIYAIGFFALKLPQVFISEPDKNKQIESYSKSGLSDDKAEEILKKLDNYMELEKPFIRSDLKSAELAKALDTSIHNLSEVLNKKLHQTFYEFINEYRVEEVKKLITNDVQKQYTLLTHSIESGFSSKSSFNTTFKKFTGQTPSQFRDSLSK